MGTKSKQNVYCRENSVKRHIQNIHAGNANFVSFVDYLVSLYWPSLPCLYQKKNDVKRIDYGNIMKEEVLRQRIRKGMGNSLI
jgi:hypothetical protein